MALVPGRRDEVRSVGPAPYPIALSPGRPLAVQAPGEASATGETLYLGTSEYTVVSAAPLGLTPALRDADGVNLTDPRWKQLPETLPARVHELAADLVTAAPTRYDAVRAVEDHLQGNATYRLDSPVPHRGEDAVDRFLFRDRTGFCEQFAAAEVVLLRAAGVPARMVTGFSGGEPDGTRRVVLESDAHAWVEVWFPGSGWVTSDPTAGTRLAQESEAWWTRVVEWLADRLATAKGRALLALVVACSVGVLALAFVAPARLRRRRRARRELPGPDGDGVADACVPLLAAFGRLEAALAAPGSRGSRSTPSPSCDVACPTTRRSAARSRCCSGPATTPNFRRRRN